MFFRNPCRFTCPISPNHAYASDIVQSCLVADDCCWLSNFEFTCLCSILEQFQNLDLSRSPISHHQSKKIIYPTAGNNCQSTLTNVYTIPLTSWNVSASDYSCTRPDHSTCTCKSWHDWPNHAHNTCNLWSTQQNLILKLIKQRVS